MGRSEFGEYSKKLRLKSGLSQLEVARTLRFKSGQIVSNWERGQCYPPLENFQRLADMYGVTLKVFFNRYSEAYVEDLWVRVNRAK